MRTITADRLEDGMIIYRCVNGIGTYNQVSNIHGWEEYKVAFYLTRILDRSYLPVHANFTTLEICWPKDKVRVLTTRETVALML